MKLKYFLTTLLAASVFAAGCSEQALENPLEEVQVSSSYVYIPLEGGSKTITVIATADWSFNESLVPEGLTISPMSGTAGTAEVTFSAGASESGIEANLEINSNGKTQYIIFKQAAIDPEITYSTCKEFNDGKDGVTYYIQGVVTMIENTEYGNLYINDGTATAYIYGTLDADGKEGNFLSLGIEVGDKISVKGPRDTYNGKIELVNATVLDIQKSAIRSEVSEYTIEKEASDEVAIELIGTGFDSYFFGKYDDDESKREPADWVSFKGMTMDDGTFTVKLAVTANEVEGFRSTTLRFTSGESIAEVTLTQKGIIPENTTAIKDLTTGDYVKVSGTVCAVSTEGVILQDADGNLIFCHDSGYAENFYEGNIVEAVGFVEIDEDKCRNIRTDMFERTGVDDDFAQPATASTIDAEMIAGYLALGDGKYVDNAYVTITGTVADGEIAVGDEYAVAAYEPAEDLDPDDFDGKTVTLTGYAVSVNSEDKILNIIVTSVAEQSTDAAE